jgi:sugar phosphate isomerase/epimerase
MLRSGLVSVSFRQLSVIEICQLAQRAGLAGIEWGGDVHVPPGDRDGAREAAHLAAEHGLQVACYGSYYRAGNRGDFAPVLETALALGAPSIRVWAGEASANCDAARRAQIVEDLKSIAQVAAKEGVAVATEYHSGTLTDTAQSAAQLAEETAGSGLFTLWQPQPYDGEETTDANIAALRAVLPQLLNIHAYCWIRHHGELRRHKFQDGKAEWARYLAELTGRDAWVLLEFVLNDEPENLIDDARTLNELIANNMGWA